MSPSSWPSNLAFSALCRWAQSHIMFQTQKGSRRFKRIENRNGVFALLVSYMDAGANFTQTLNMLRHVENAYISDGCR